MNQTMDDKRIRVIDMSVRTWSHKDQVEVDVARLLKLAFPHWKRRDIIIETVGSREKIGYSIKNTDQKAVVKFFNNEIESKFEMDRLECVILKGYSPRILFTFDNGYIMERSGGLQSLASFSLGNITTSNNLIYRVVKRLGCFHRELTSNPRDYMECPAFDDIRYYTDNVGWPHLTSVPEYSTVRHELEELLTRSSQVTMKTVTCHNNLNTRNVLVKCVGKEDANTSDADISFVGLENLGSNVQPWDLATLLLTLDTDTGLLHSGARKIFDDNCLRYYLSGYQNCHLQDVDQQRLTMLHSQVKLCTLIYLLKEMTRSVYLGDCNEGLKYYQLYKKEKYDAIGFTV